ncbi:MAG: hypothetical protein K2N23_06255, partial [Clostridia bacterium]|nr:hypothetical protein [Clostridia bacterium]
MGKQKSEREKKLQKKLIPVNIIVCIIALTAALTLFLTPILKVDVGATLRKQSVMELVEEKIVGTVDNSLEGSDQEDINYKPVVSMIVKEVFGKAEGEISVSALSAFRVLTGSGDKTQIAMDELLLGEDALATRLIDSVVDAVANVFTTDEGKDLLEDAVVRVMTKKIINEADDEEVSKTLNEVLTNQNVKELVGILKDLENVEDGDASEVAGKFIDKVNAMLGDKASIKDEDRQVVIDQVQEIYDGTKEHLADDESVSIEAVICVTLSENVDISTIKLENLIGKIKDLGGKKDKGSIHMNEV